MTRTASPKQITYIRSLLATHEHTDNGKTITIGDTRVRATADTLDQISTTTASKLITALKEAPAKAIEAPHFTQVGGRWIVAAGLPEWKHGDIVEITTRSGDTRRVRLALSGMVAGKWDFTDAPEDTTEGTTEVAEAPAPARDGYARRTHYTRRYVSADQCGVCGGRLDDYDRDVAAISGVHADCI